MRLPALLILAAACGSPDRPAPVAAPEPATVAAAPEPAPEPKPEPAKPSKDPAEARRACSDEHDSKLRSPDVTAAELAEAARCFGDAGGVGLQITIAKQIVRRFPASPEARDAFVTVGEAYEAAYALEPKSHHLIEAAKSYETYGAKYSRAARAAELLIRAACIRHSVDPGDRRALERDLALLRRLRRGAAPITSGEEACAETPPLPEGGGAE
jgi:hypothetical protein